MESLAYAETRKTVESGRIIYAQSVGNFSSHGHHSKLCGLQIPCLAIVTAYHDMSLLTKIIGNLSVSGEACGVSSRKHRIQYSPQHLRWMEWRRPRHDGAPNEPNITRSAFQWPAYQCHCPLYERTHDSTVLSSSNSRPRQMPGLYISSAALPPGQYPWRQGRTPHPQPRP